jgi:hypothetical protein
MAKKVKKFNPYAATPTTVLVAKAIVIDREVEELKGKLSTMKGELIERAARAPKEDWKAGENDSQYIDFLSADGQVAQVIASTPTLRSLDMNSEDYRDLRNIIRSDEKFWSLFLARKTAIPVDDFREFAVEGLTKEQLQRVLEVIENDATLKVNFRTKEKAA